MNTKPPKHYHLSKATQRKLNKPYVDYDYLDKLTPEERDWLNKFSGEYYDNNFSKEDPLHSKELRKERYDAYNARGRDTLNRGRIDVLSETCAPQSTNHEDAVIKAIDKLAKIKAQTINQVQCADSRHPIQGATSQKAIRLGRKKGKKVDQLTKLTNSHRVLNNIGMLVSELTFDADTDKAKAQTEALAFLSSLVENVEKQIAEVAVESMPEAVTVEV